VPHVIPRATPAKIEAYAELLGVVEQVKDVLLAAVDSDTMVIDTEGATSDVAEVARQVTAAVK
jgi:hypothetical protein